MGTLFFYKGDLPKSIQFKNAIAVDTETMGLNLHRDRLCLVQIADEKGDCYLVQILKDTDPVVLKAILSDKNLLKIFHFARFDIAAIYQNLKIICAPVYCTKIAHKLVRTSTEHHGLKYLCNEMLGVTLAKEQQISDWGASHLSEEQQKYAANDVLYLHALKEKLDALLMREGRSEIAQNCFDFLPSRALLDLMGFDTPDIFEH